MKLLFVNCCISQRGTGSRTHALADAFLTAFQASHPGAEVEEVTPEALLALKPFDAEVIDKVNRQVIALVKGSKKKKVDSVNMLYGTLLR